MAHCKQESQTHKYVVLSVKEGFGFSFVKNKLLRIVVEFEKKTLSSQPVYTLSAPAFNCNFTWRIKNTLLDRLYKARAKITIEFKVQVNNQAERSLGFARIGLNLAQFVSTHDTPYFHCLGLQGVKIPFGYRVPQIFVSLTIQSIVRINATEDCYSTELEDSTKDTPESANQASSFGNAPTTSDIRSSSSSSKKQPYVKKVVLKKVQSKPSLVTVHERNENLDSSESKEDETLSASACYFTSQSELELHRSNEDSKHTTTPTKSSYESQVKTESAIRTQNNGDKTTTTSTGIKKEREKKRTVQPVEPIIISTTPNESNVLSSDSDSYSTTGKDKNNFSDNPLFKPLDPSFLDAFIPSFAEMDFSSRPKTTTSSRTPSRSLRSFLVKAFENFTEVSKKTSVTTLPSLNEDDDTEVFHLYKLELQVENIEWTKTFKDTKVFVKFYNPSANNTVNVEDKDYSIPNLQLSDVICYMFYISQPSQLLETIFQHPPHILIQKSTNEKLIAKVIVTVTDLKQILQTDYFHSDAQLLAKDDEVLGTVNLLLKFTDLGIPPSDENSDFLRSVIEYKKQAAKEEMMSSEAIESIFKDFQRLFGIHERLRDIYQKISESFENMLSYSEKIKETEQSNERKKQVSNDSKISEQLSTKTDQHARKKDDETIKSTLDHDGKKDSKISTEIKSQVVKRPKEPSSKTSSSRSEKILFCEFCHEYHKIKKDCEYITAIETITVDESEEKKVSVDSRAEDQIKADPKHKISPNAKQIAIQTVKPISRDKPKQTASTSKPSSSTVKRQCHGCEKYLEADYGKQVWQDNELVFWCKDCNIKQLQSKLKDTVHNYNEEIIGLRDYVKNLENEHAKLTANTVSKEEYERLTAAQHNLTMLYIHAQEQNTRLQNQCADTATKLEELVKQYQPQITSTTQPNNQLRVNEDPTDSPSTTNELLQEIRNFRLKDAMIQREVMEKAEKEFLRENQAQKSEIKLTPSRRRERCEACRILQSKSKTWSLIKPSKSGQSSSSFSLRSSENRLLSSSTSQQSAYKADRRFRSDTEESKESTTTLLTGMCIHDVREKIEEVQEKIQHYLEERDELVRTYHYTSENPVVSYMTKTINKLFKEWNELNKYSQSITKM